MGCPYCGCSLKGYVEYGSTGYGRVGNGCCPSCGRKVEGLGFAGGSNKPTSNKIKKTISEREFLRESRYNILQILISSIIGGFTGLLTLLVYQFDLGWTLSISIVAIYSLTFGGLGMYAYRKHAGPYYEEEPGCLVYFCLYTNIISVLGFLIFLGVKYY